MSHIYTYKEAGKCLKDQDTADSEILFDLLLKQRDPDRKVGTTT
jgi:hypothetical protein